MRHFYLSVVLLSGILLCCCAQREFTLEWALNLAGDNRAELERVLDHYKQNPADSQKYRAAVYLITNMPGHYSVDSVLANRFCDKADSVMAIPLDTSFLELSKTDFNMARNLDWEKFKVPALEKISKEMPFKQESLRPDIQVIKADYLIKNIDSAFATWKTSPWSAHLNFDHFCEFILPYKVQDPFLPDDWREYCRKFCDSIVDLSDMDRCQYYKNSIHWAARFVNSALLPNMRIIGPYTYNGNQPIRMSTWIKKHFVSCGEKGIVCMAVMRSKGIPMAVDYTPQWPTGYEGHSWCAVLTTAGGNYEKFDPFEGFPGEAYRPGETMAKAFREGYAINPLLFRINRSGEDVPPFLRNSFIKDVTSDYMSTQTIEVSIPDSLKQQNRFAYLSMFDNKNWVPIAWGEVKRSKVRFEDIGRSVAYLPSYYIDGKVVPFSYPFTLDANGRAEYMIPDTTRLQSVDLTRKYPPHYHVYNTTKRLIGGKFQAANRPDFRDSVTVFEFPEGWNDPTGTIDLSRDTAKYRYWRFLSPPDRHNQMAEVRFYLAGDTVPNTGKIIGTPGTRIGDPKNHKEAMFDNDPFTFFDAPFPYDGWAGMDYGKPVSMDRILFVYRSDDNNVWIGDEYELFYWKDRHGWASLGKQKAENLKLHYDSIPTHALFFIRDYTRGVQERIFTIEDGKQVWW